MKSKFSAFESFCQIARSQTSVTKHAFAFNVFLAVIIWLIFSPPANAQLAPSIGYMFPSGGQAGQTIEVTLGGYDWTPDMQLFVRDPSIQLEIIGEPGPVLVPEPPYWFGKKARRAPYKLPRETKARLTIPPNVTPGIYRWQAANANGATACGRFSVSALPGQLESSGTVTEVRAFPIHMYGCIELIREVDRYQFVSPVDGWVECKLVAASISSPLRAIVEVRNAQGKLLTDAADTAGSDLRLFFRASAGESYTVAVYDLDFCGDKSFVYELTISPAQERNEQAPTNRTDTARTLTVPVVVSESFDGPGNEDRYRIAGQAGDMFVISATGSKMASLVDPLVTVLDATGKEVARGDDSTDSTDAFLEFSPPSAGEYEIVVSDLSGARSAMAANYELSIQRAEPDFQLLAADMQAVPIGGKATIEVKAVRRGGLNVPIDIEFVDLPQGISVAGKVQMAAKQNTLKVEVQCDAASAAHAKMVTVRGQAVINGQNIQRTSEPILLCSTIKPPFTIDAEGQDDVTKWPRGTTFPAPVLISRDPDFKGDIVLEMTSLQGRHVQGIAGPELRVKPNESRVLYPVFLPEWLETTRTSRMVVNGVAQVADPKGNLRYCLSKQKTRMGFLPTGALLKISAEPEIDYSIDKPMVIPVVVHRDAALNQSLTLTLVSDGSEPYPFSAEPQKFAENATRCEFAVNVRADAMLNEEYALKIRATLVRDDNYPVISETTVIVHQTKIR